jgi:hypothetical protein
MTTSRFVFLAAVAAFAGQTACFAERPSLSLSPRSDTPDSAASRAAIRPGGDYRLALDAVPTAGPGANAVDGATPAVAPTFVRPPLTLDVPTLAAAHVLYADAAASAPAGETDEDLAKKLQNPVAALISVPLQFNGDFGIGPKNAGRYTLNIQPVIPISLNDDWNVIVRTIVPLIYRESSSDTQQYKFGTGDIVQSFFFSPKAPVGGWILAIGPVFLWPTASDDSLGSGQWGAGPTALALKQDGGWTYGLLINHMWSYAGPHSRQDVNATFLQPFISYTFPSFTTIGLNAESTYDWTNHQWTIPINLNVSQLVKINGQPVSFSLGGRYYAEGPSGGPEWGVRFVVTFLFPK